MTFVFCYFFFYIIPKQLWMEGGGNNFLLIYIYILENSCEGWGKPSYPPPPSPSPMPCALISDSHIGHIYTQHTKTYEPWDSLLIALVHYRFVENSLKDNYI